MLSNNLPSSFHAHQISTTLQVRNMESGHRSTQELHQKVPKENPADLEAEDYQINSKAAVAKF